MRVRAKFHLVVQLLRQTKICQLHKFKIQTYKEQSEIRNGVGRDKHKTYTRQTQDIDKASTRHKQDINKTNTRHTQDKHKT